MALDPNIILQGRSPNLLNSMALGAQLASAQNDMAQQSQMRNFLRDNGQAVFQGDPQALGQLAQYDPQGAVNIDSTRQRLTMARQQSARQAQAEARNLSAAEAQEAAARIERAVAGGLQAQSPEQWDAFVKSVGAENLVGQFENRELIAAQYLGVKDALEAARGPESKPTDDMREFEFARQQGYEGSFQDWMMENRRAGASTTNVNVGEGDKFYETLDKQQAEMFGTLITDGSEAARTTQTLDRLSGILEGTPTGSGAAFKAALGSFGIPTEGLDDVQAAQALINQMVPAQRPPGSGPMSDADLALFKQSVPRLINQPGGNQKIIDTMRGIADYTRKQAGIANQVANREISPAEGRKMLQALDNPMEGFDAGNQAAESSNVQDQPDGAVTFETFAADPNVQKAAKKADVTVQQMWEVKQAQEKEGQ